MIDLSHPVLTGMPVYPGDPEVHISAALTLERDGVAVSRVHIGSHSGTHLDAPSHTVVGGRTLAGVELGELVGEALVLRVADQHDSLPSRTALGPAELGLDRLQSVPRIVAIHTGWDQFFGAPRYRDHPYLTREAVEQLWSLGMRLLAVDFLSPDETPAVDGDEVPNDFPVHDVVLGRDGLIVENVRGLELVEDRVRLGFFPLRLGAVDGAPVRAVAFESLS